MLGMSDSFFTEVLNGSLSEITHKKRRNLLLASTVSIVSGTVDMVPTKLNALGIGFFPSAFQGSLLFLMATIIAYFILAFIRYGLADFFIWRKNYQNYLITLKRATQNWSYEDQSDYEELHQNISRVEWLYNWYVPIAFLKLTFEFAVPLIAGVFAVCILLI
jgi:hypothetical protein